MVRQFMGTTHRVLLALVAGLSVAAVCNQAAIAATISLSSGFDPATATTRGSTRGSFGLPAIANRDRNNNFCLGYGNDQQVPDHTLVLQQNFSRLTIQVNSRTNDTTLLIKGPDGTVRCGDTSISDGNWKPGRYSVWIGSPEGGSRRDYTMIVRE